MRSKRETIKLCKLVRERRWMWLMVQTWWTGWTGWLQLGNSLVPLNRTFTVSMVTRETPCTQRVIPNHLRLQLEEILRVWPVMLAWIWERFQAVLTECTQCHPRGCGLRLFVREKEKKQTSISMHHPPLLPEPLRRELAPTATSVLLCLPLHDGS